ncbi:Protein N-terminal amidase [Wickerhamiella sorbophila]|uniref:Protein N-terminal amidase n=1 Tax=Wickerhamiella sorbophila TaxID=45607 RepID=A0A2T0FIB5_9ASCO|nr:Protein N-terminal amidase [Wickerhamiella sorbophila]PRT54744.1 Protein N-terminal amidase [Wickerhamiella sorbophila]
MKLTLAAVQMGSKLGKVAGNMAVAESLLQKITQRPAVAVLPELALTGYAFESPKAIAPYLESRNGPSTQWACEMAKNYDINICIGYPETTSTGTIYNAASLCSSKGNVLMNYRKTHLYETDRQWGCCPSPEGFIAGGPWPDFPIKTQIGICMDLNPHEFTAPWDAYEFARSIASNKSQLVLVPTAWLAGDYKSDELDHDLVDYWRARIPLDVPIVIANRTGNDGSTVYGGSSTILYSDNSYSVAGEGVVEHTVEI